MTDAPAHLSSDDDLGNYGKIAVGCMGGFLAAVGGAILTNQASIANDVTDVDAWFVGVAVRIVAFTALGGLWVWLNVQQNDRMKVFQSGLLAPAMLTAMFYSSTPTQAHGAPSEPDPAPRASVADMNLPFPTVLASVGSLYFNRDDQSDERPKTLKCIISGFMGHRC